METNEKKQKKDQYVIAYLPCLDDTDMVLTHAVHMADMLQKGLILMHVSDPEYTNVTPDEAEPRLNALIPSLRPQLPNLPITYAALKGNTQMIINALPEMIGAVIIVAQVNAHSSRKSPLHPKCILKDFAECKIAYLTVQERYPERSTPKKVVFSIDYHKESKEKFVWASYFARFGKCRLTAMHYDYKDEGLSYKCKANLKFMSKLYDSLDVKYDVLSIDRSGAYTDCAIFKQKTSIFDLMVSVTTKEKDMIEYFTGTQENRTITNKDHIPVLYLNPREDIYVLCD